MSLGRRSVPEYRLAHGMKVPDAVHLATAVLNRCDWLVTLDDDFPWPSRACRWSARSC